MFFFLTIISFKYKYSPRSGCPHCGERVKEFAPRRVGPLYGFSVVDNHNAASFWGATPQDRPPRWVIPFALYIYKLYTYLIVCFIIYV